MKRIFYLFCILIAISLLVGCARDFNPITGPQVTSEMANVEPVTDTGNCKYIKTVYFEVSQPSWIHKYATKNVIAAGGDSYKILNDTTDTALGMTIYGTNIAIYKCK